MSRFLKPSYRSSQMPWSRWRRTIVLGTATTRQVHTMIDPTRTPRWLRASSCLGTGIALAALGGTSSVSLLLETLSDPDSDVRACAALGLGALAAAEAAAPLTHLLADESAYVGRIAGNALIQIGQPAAPVLIETLSSPSPASRAGAARALVPLESHAAIPALFAALDDESVLVTHYAQEALWRMGVGMVLIKP